MRVENTSVIKRLRLLGTSKMLVLTSVFLFSISALANPVVDRVDAGSVTIQQTPSTTTIHQSSPKAIINWQSFNIGKGEHTHFQQPAGGITLNRISPTQGASAIYGILTATGKIILVNPAGIFFGPSAYVNVGGLIATTANIGNQQFMSGQYQFVNAGPGAIINQGEIIAAQNGLVALIGSGVSNSGMISANLGKVVLASGEAFTMNFAGNDLISFTIDAKASGPALDPQGKPLPYGVNNTGKIYANGGAIMVSASTARNVLDHVINLDGVLQATSVSQRKGMIIISGDSRGGVVHVRGTLNASGKKAGESGGGIQITGRNILISSGAVIDASGDLGGGSIYIGGNAYGVGPLPNSKAVVVTQGTQIKADAITNGNGGQIILWSDDLTKAYGSLSARGGQFGGNGGFIETSSKNVLDVNGVTVDTSAIKGMIGTWLLDPWNVLITNAATSGGTFDGSSPNTFTPTASSTVNTADIETNLGTANVIITTSGAGPDPGNITVASSINWSSGNTLTLQADGAITINAGITATNNGTLQLTGTAINILAPLEGDFNLITNSTGTTTLGATIGNTTALASVDVTSTNPITINTNLIQTTGNQTYTGDVILTSDTSLNAVTSGDIHITGNVDGGNNDLTLTDTGAGGSIDGVISNLSSLTISGLGSIALLNTNTYSGPTLITSSGTLYLANNDALGTSTLTVDGIVALAGSTLIILNDIILNTGSTVLDNNFFGSNELSGDITITGNVTYYINSFFSNSLLLSGVLSGTGINLIKDGNGALIFAGANTYTGTTTLTNGQIALANSNALGGSTATIASGTSLILSGSSLIIANNITFDNSSTLLDNNVSSANTLSGALSLNGTTTFSIGDATGLLTLSGAIGGIGITLSKAGLGTLTLSGTNTYAGLTDITAGTLNLQSNGALGASTATVGSNAILSLTGNALNISNNMTFGGTGELVDNSASGTNTLSGTLTLNGNASITVSNSTTSLSASGIITDGASSFTLTKLGNGVLTLANANTYDGGTTISAGTLVISHNNALGTASAVVSNGATLASSGSGLVINTPITINGTGVNNVGALANLNGSNTFSNTITLGSSNTSIGVSNLSDTLSLSGVLTQLSSGFNFIKSGLGTLTLSNSNTFSGTTSISAGTLNLTNANALGTTSSVTVTNGATLRLSNISHAATVPLTLNGSTALISTGTSTWNGAITLGSATTISGDNLTLNGTINGTADLTLNGAGTITLTGAIGGTTALTSLLSNSALNLNSGTISTTSIQLYNSGITLGANTIFNTTNNLLSFSSIDRDGVARTATFNSGSGSIALSGNVGAGGALGAITLNSTGTTTITGTVNAASITTNAGGTTQINSTNITTSGNQTYNDNVSLGASPTLRSGAGTINFSGFVSGIGRTLTLQDNTLSSTGNITFNGNVTLQGLVTFGGAANYAVNLLGGTNTISNAVTFNNTNGVTLGNGADTFNFSGGLVSTASTTTINGTINTSGNALTLGVVSVLGDLLLNSAGGAITLGATNSNVAGTNTLTLTAGAGAITLNGAIGGTNSFSQFTATNSGATNDIVISNAINTTGDISVTAGRHITIGNGNITSTTGNINLTGTAGQIQTTGSGSLHGATLTTNAVGGISLTNGNTFTTFNASNTSGGAIAFTNTAATLTLSGITQSGSGAVTITNTGNINLTGNLIGGSGNAVSLLGTGTLIESGTSFISGGLLTTTSTGGTSLLNANAITGFNATNNGTGAITLINTSNPSTLLITGITQNATGAAVTINNIGALTITTGSDILLAGGDVMINTLSPDSAERILTVDGTIHTNGGDINLSSANNTSGNSTALIINNTLDTSPGTGGTLTLSSGLALNASPIIGTGDVTLQGNGLDLTLGTVTLGTNTTFNALRFITITGALTSTAGANLSLIGDVNNTGVGGVWVQSTGSINSAGSLLIRGASLAGLSGADANAAIQIDSGATVTAANSITALATTGNKNIIINGPVQTTSGTMTITPAGSGSIQLGAAVRSLNNAITINAPVIVTTGGAVDAGNNTVTFNNTVTGQTLALQNSSATGTVTFNNDVSLDNLTTYTQPYSIQFHGTNTTFTSLVTFNNTGTVALGNGGDIVNFNSGITHTAGITSFNLSQFNLNNSAVTLGPVTLNANTTINSGSGAIALGSISGGFTLNLSSSNGTTFNGNASLGSLMVSGGGNDVINTSAITTTGVQTYNNPVTLATNTTLTGASINFVDGIMGNRNIDIIANAITINGALSLLNLGITGMGVNNQLTLDTTNTQSWTVYDTDIMSLATAGISGAIITNIQLITGSSGNDIFAIVGGVLTGMIDGGVGVNTLIGDNGTNSWTITGANAGSATAVAAFQNFQHLDGSASANNTFTLAGGSISGTVTGSSGSNTIVADNVSNQWNINGTNAGSVTGISSFNNIQNLTGGMNGNNFIFANNAMITGFIDGNNPAQPNSLNFVAYTSTVKVVLTNTHTGSVENNLINIVGGFDNIDYLYGNYSTNNTITVPSGKISAVVYTGPQSGYIDDPTYFDGFVVDEAPPPVPPVPPVPPPTPTNTLGNVSAILDQPTTGEPPALTLINIDVIVQPLNYHYVIDCSAGNASVTGTNCSSIVIKLLPFVVR